MLRPRALFEENFFGWRAAIPSEKFTWEFLPPIEVSNLLCYLVFTRISSLRPWKVWICTARLFLVSLRQFKRKKSQAKLLWPKVRNSQRMNDTLLDHCRKCPSQPSSGKIFWKLLTVKEQTDIQDLTTVDFSLSFIGTIMNSWSVWSVERLCLPCDMSLRRRARIRQLVFP